MQPYAQPPGFDEEAKRLSELVHKCPTVEKRGYGIAAIYGTMGVGKTRYAQELMMAATQNLPEGRNVIRLYVTLSDIRADWSAKDDIMDILAKTLTYALDPEVPHWNGITWSDVTQQAKKDLGDKPLVLLNIDEAHSKLEGKQDLKHAIVAACQSTMRARAPPSGRLVVIPVLSGVFNIARPQLDVSDFVDHNIHLKALKDDALEGLKNAFCKTLGISQLMYESNNLENLRRLFDMCGGFPYLVDSLQQEMRSSTHAKARSDRALCPETAQVVFENVIGRIQLAYGKDRWHAFMADKAITLDKREGNKKDIGTRISFQLATKMVMRRVLLDIITERKINPNDYIISPIPDTRSDSEFKYFKSSMIKYRDLDESGVVEIVNECVRAPLLVIIVMNSVVELFPGEAKVREPFHKNWETHEHLALFTLCMRLEDALSKPKGLSTKLSALRPGAQWFGADNVLVRGIGPSKDGNRAVSFTFWHSYCINASAQMQIERTSKLKEAFLEPMVAMPVVNEKAIDGVMYVPGNRRTKQVLLLSQSKARGLSQDKNTPGELAETVLTNADVKILVEEMRTQKNQLVNAYPHLANATFVYEVFSNRFAPTHEDKLVFTDLKNNERAIVVRGDRFVSVLGEPLADMRHEIKRSRLTVDST